MYPIPQSADYYRLIGKILVTRMPEVAEDLLTKYNDDKTRVADVLPLETDHKKISIYFSLFCKKENKDSTSFLGYVRDKSCVVARTEFVAAVLHIYSPMVYRLTKEQIYIKDLKGRRFIGPGLTQSLCDVLNVNRSSMSRTVRKIVVMEKAYEDFREKVHELYSSLLESQAQSKVAHNFGEIDWDNVDSVNPLK